MKRSILSLITVLTFSIAMAQPPQGGQTNQWVPYFRYDKAIPDSTTFYRIVEKFQQLTFKDDQTGATLEYNLFIPDNYNPAKSYPLVLFMADASVAGKEVTRPLTQGLGAVIWASDYEQSKHPAFVLAPQYNGPIANSQKETANVTTTVDLVKDLCKRYSIDTDRLYTTGQSAGCMASVDIDIRYPDLFAASYLCSGQWETELTTPLAKQNIWITVAEGDLRAYPGMNDITEFLQSKGATVTKDYISARASDEQLDYKVKEMLSKHANINYLVLGSVIPDALKGSRQNAADHMCSWLTTYSIEAIRDWLFNQRKGSSLSLKLKDAHSSDIMLAPDMGDWHGTNENSLRSIEKAIEKGSSMVPIDIKRTRDGKLVLFKDDTLGRLMAMDSGSDFKVEDLTLTQLRHYAYKNNGGPDIYSDKHVPTLAEAIAFSQGKIILFIKNALPYMDQIAEIIQTLDAKDMVVVGGMTEPVDTKGLMYIPTVDLNPKDGIQHLDHILQANPVAVHLIFSPENIGVFKKAVEKAKGKCRIMVNISHPEQAGGFKDLSHNEDASTVYDPLIKSGATLIMCNEVKPLSRYLRGDSNLWRAGK